MKTFALIFLGIAIIIAACNPKPVTDKGMALADSLIKVNENAYNSGDAQQIINLFADNALMIVNGKATCTKDSILVLVKSIAPVLKNFRAYRGPTTVTNDIIQIQKYFTGDIVAGNNIMKGAGVATLVYKKQADNSWKIVMELEHYDIKPF